MAAKAVWVNCIVMVGFFFEVLTVGVQHMEFHFGSSYTQQAA
jgi:hypothetical protein